MAEQERPPTIAIVGAKDSGKTSLLVALAAELRRRGLRVASVKHAHHDAHVDRPGTDSWRHYHEGGVEAVLLVTRGRLALVSHLSGEEEADPGALVDRYFAGRGLDLVLVEGYKHGPFPKIEIHRKGSAPALYPTTDAAAAALFLAIVTDDDALATPCPMIPLDPDDPAGSHVAAIADLITDLLPKRADGR